MKRNFLCLIYILLIMSLSACSKKTEVSREVTQNIQIDQTTAETEQTTTEAEQEFSSQEHSTQPYIDEEMTSEELLDLFINGSINAIDSTDMASEFNISDLDMDSDEWDSYSIGERVDLDNDGENELIICGPYGGMYLDARDNKIYQFAAGDGNAIRLSYTYYNGEIWILYSNNMYAGYECYHMEKYEGADNLVAEMYFSAEAVDATNPDSEMTYLLNEKEISYDEYFAFCSKIFAAEVSTNAAESVIYCY